jgi:hypothetical protein
VRDSAGTNREEAILRAFFASFTLGRLPEPLLEGFAGPAGEWSLLHDRSSQVSGGGAIAPMPRILAEIVWFFADKGL